MKYDYNFYVHSPEEIDIPRIIREAPPGTNAIIVSGDANSVLLVKGSFLRRFHLQDEIAVAYELLRATWGYPLLTGWRISAAFQKSDIPRVAAEFRSASRALADKREVRVIYP